MGFVFEERFRELDELEVISTNNMLTIPTSEYKELIIKATGFRALCMQLYDEYLSRGMKLYELEDKVKGLKEER